MEETQRGELPTGNVDSWSIQNPTGGQRHVTDHSNAFRAISFNVVHTLRWDEKFCEASGILEQMLREVAFSDAGVGSMGLSIGADIPIQGIRGDQQAGLFGQTCFEPKLAKNTLGTAGVYSMNTGLEPPVTDGLSTVVACGSKCGATYMTEGVASCASTTTRQLPDASEIVRASCDSEWYGSQDPDTQGVYFVPVFSGLTTPYRDRHARRTVFGTSSSTSELCKAASQRARGESLE